MSEAKMTKEELASYRKQLKNEKMLQKLTKQEWQDHAENFIRQMRINFYESGFPMEMCADILKNEYRKAKKFVDDHKHERQIK